MYYDFSVFNALIAAFHILLAYKHKL